MQGRVGAPSGLTVHWLMEALLGEFSRAYKLEYNNKFHHYRYARYRKKTLIDEFIVVRTSKRCYRVTYFNRDYLFFKYFSARNYKKCAEIMTNTYRTFRQLEEYEHNYS